jgi:hypothetical protein
MKAEDYRPIRKLKPKHKGKLSTRKRLMLAVAQEWIPIASLKLRETYFSKTVWIKKIITQ